MSSKLWVNYLFYVTLIGILIWGFSNSDLYKEPFLAAFICFIMVGTLLAIPRETRLRQLLNTDRLAGLEKRVAQRKYEYIMIAVITLCCGLLHLYYNANDIHSPGLYAMSFTILGTIIGSFIKASADKQEIKEIKQKQSK